MDYWDENILFEIEWPGKRKVETTHHNLYRYSIDNIPVGILSMDTVSYSHINIVLPFCDSLGTR